MRQTPDFGPVPSLPEFLDIFPLNEQVMDGFDQQDVFPGNARPEGDQIQRRLIERLAIGLLPLQFHAHPRPYHVLRNREGNVQVYSRRGQDGGPQTRVAAGYNPRQLATVGITPQGHGGTTFRQEPACQSADFGDRLPKSYLCRYLPIGPVKYPLNLARPALKLGRCHRRCDIESRPIASAGDSRKSAMVIRVAAPAVEQNDRRPIPPLSRTAIKPAISHVVLSEFARSRRREAEFLSTGEFQSCWLAPSRNEIRSFQKLNRCFEPRIGRVVAPFHQGAKPPAPHDLDSRPVNKFGQTCNHSLGHTVITSSSLFLAHTNTPIPYGFEPRGNQEKPSVRTTAQRSKKNARETCVRK